MLTHRFYTLSKPFTPIVLCELDCKDKVFV